MILADSSATVTEGNSGTTSVQYCIVLDSDEELARDVVFLASTMDGSAGKQAIWHDSLAHARVEEDIAK